MHKKANFEDFINIGSIFVAPFYRVEISFLFFPWIYDGLLSYDKHTLFYYPSYEQFVNSLVNVKEIILDVFWDLSAEERSLIFFELKLQIERFYYRKFNTGEFEVQRVKSIHSIDKVVVQIACRECKSIFPILIPIEELLTRHFGRKSPSNFYPCSNCSSKERSYEQIHNFPCSILDDVYYMEIYRSR